MTEEKAVSEVVGYVIIIGIVFVAFGLIFFNATSLFSDTERSESLENAQRGLTVLQSNVDDVVLGESPRQTTQVRLGGGSVSVDRTSTTLKIGGDPVTNTTVNMSSVEYRLGDESLSYENGAVFRHSVSGTAMASEPGWVIRDDMVSIQGVRTFGGGSVGGDGTVSVRTASAGDATTRKIPPYKSGDVKVEIISQNSGAWNRYFEQLNESDTSDTITDVDHTPADDKVEVDLSISSSPGDGQAFVYIERPVRVRLR